VHAFAVDAVGGVAITLTPKVMRTFESAAWRALRPGVDNPGRAADAPSAMLIAWRSTGCSAVNRIDAFKPPEQVLLNNQDTYKL
jgi:hypothetical protein